MDSPPQQGIMGRASREGNRTLASPHRLEMWIVGGIGKDSASQSASFIYGANAGTRLMDVMRVGAFYQSLTIKEPAFGGTFDRRVHLFGLDIGAYLPLVLDGFFAGIKLGVSKSDGGTSNGVSVLSDSHAVLGFTGGYDYLVLPILSLGLEANIMCARNVLYSLLGSVKLWL